MFELKYLGHAGWLIKNNKFKIVCDPWFSPQGAFLSSWFPFPRNDHMLIGDLFDDLDFIYISHAHEDHFDKWTLQHAKRTTPVIIPRFDDRTLYNNLKKLDFEDVRELSRNEHIISNNIRMKIIEDEDFFDNDSCLLLDDGESKVLNLNDCHIAFEEIKNLVGEVDLLLLQSSSANWWPCAYDYDSASMKDNCRIKKNNILKRTLQYSRALNAKNVIPNAGPPIFLDPQADLWNYNRENSNPFIRMDASVDFLNSENISSSLVIPGSTIRLFKSEMIVDTDDRERSLIYDNYEEYLASYKSHLRENVEMPIVTEDEISQLISKFSSQIKNIKKVSKFYIDKVQFPILFDFKDLGKWIVDFTKEECFFRYKNEEYNYFFIMDPKSVCLLFREKSIDFERYFLSLNFQSHREIDAYNEHLFAILKNFDTKRFIASEKIYAKKNDVASEMFELTCNEGRKLSVRRYCPHKMVDLKKNGFINDNNELVCPLHAWRFDLGTGECINHSGVENILGETEK